MANKKVHYASFDAISSHILAPIGDEVGNDMFRTPYQSKIGPDTQEIFSKYYTYVKQPPYSILTQGQMVYPAPHL